MSRRIVIQSKNSIGHVEIPDDAEFYEEGQAEHIEPPLLNPDINRAQSGEDDTIDLHGQSEIQTSSQSSSEPPLGLINWNHSNKK